MFTPGVGLDNSLRSFRFALLRLQNLSLLSIRQPLRLKPLSPSFHFLRNTLIETQESPLLLFYHGYVLFQLSDLLLILPFSLLELTAMSVNAFMAVFCCGLDQFILFFQGGMLVLQGGDVLEMFLGDHFILIEFSGFDGDLPLLIIYFIIQLFYLIMTLLQLPFQLLLTTLLLLQLLPQSLHRLRQLLHHFLLSLPQSRSVAFAVLGEAEFLLDLFGEEVEHVVYFVEGGILREVCCWYGDFLEEGGYFGFEFEGHLFDFEADIVVIYMLIVLLFALERGFRPQLLMPHRLLPSHLNQSLLTCCKCPYKSFNCSTDLLALSFWLLYSLQSMKVDAAKFLLVWCWGVEGWL